MSGLEDGWKRIMRELQERVNGLGYASLVCPGEDLGTVAQNDWVSPTNVNLFGSLPPKNFLYGGGSLTYTGTKRVRVLVSSTQSILVGGGNQATAEVTNGVNSVPCVDGIMPSSSAFGNEILQDTTCTFELDPGDTLDVFTRQTSEVGGANITILKGVYHIWVIDVLE